MKKPTIFLATGGTGGHVFPAIAVYEELTKRLKNPVIICDPRGANYVPQNFKKIILPIKPNAGNFLQKFFALFTIFIAIFTCIKIYLRYKPSAVIGFGSYACFPTVFAAILFRKKIIIHEQNSIIGKANAFLSKFASKLALSFEGTKGINKNLDNKIIITGNPVRSEIASISKLPYPAFDGNSLVHILVTGGSQGSKIFSKIIPEAINQLPAEIKTRVRIDQQVRISEIEEVKDFYKKNTINADIAMFFNDMARRLTSCNLVICRSGASTIAELAIAKRPAIFVPLKTAKMNHQEVNARNFENQNAGKVILEDDFTSENLRDVLVSLIENPEILNQFSDNCSKLSVENSALKIANLV
jgi:UDP-N-acetylglucosamine--N-acetylmuramyl-(pentapeptide) pyrophosphoryl-undecaprenol N-acetylglucosamine transferase